MTDVLFRKVVAERPEVIEPNTAYLILKGEGEDEAFDLLVSSASGDRLVPLDMAAAGGGGAVADPNVQTVILSEDYFCDRNPNAEPAPPDTIIPGFEFSFEAGETYELEVVMYVQYTMPASSRALIYKVVDSVDLRGLTFFANNVGIVDLGYHDNRLRSNVSTDSFTAIDYGANAAGATNSIRDRHEFNLLSTATAAGAALISTPVQNNESARIYLKGSRMTKRRLS